MNGKEWVRVGAGAGTSDDRIVPALELAERGELDFLVFECLAERTVSRENLARTQDPEKGYSPLLHARLRMVLPACMNKGIRIISNMGAANPLGGAPPCGARRGNLAWETWPRRRGGRRRHRNRPHARAER